MKNILSAALACLLFCSTTANCDAMKLTTPADLQDKRIGVLLGSVHDKYVIEQYPKATILQYKSPSDIILAVKSGKIDAGIYTRETNLHKGKGD